MEANDGSTEALAKARRGGSREAIVEAAERLFLERGFGSVSMDELAEAAGVARRTLYNQFASKEEIFREMLLRVSGQLEHAFPPGIETQGDVEDVLRLIARVILDLHKNPEYLGFLRMVVADFAPVSVDRRGVRRRHGSSNGAARALSRPSDGHGHPGLPQSDAGRSPVHGDPQRVLSVALDDGSRKHTVSRTRTSSKRRSGCSCGTTAGRGRNVRCDDTTSSSKRLTAWSCKERRRIKRRKHPMNVHVQPQSALGDRRLPFKSVALVLQGGGALGAYQAGVYEALAEAGIDPDWVAGVSIGAINAALIAGNPPEARVDKLRAFWDGVTTNPHQDWTAQVLASLAEGDAARQILNQTSALSALIAGAPGFFGLRFPPPLFQQAGAIHATSFYDTSDLATTLERLIDFERINAGATRLSVGAVNVRTGNFVYFDTATHRIEPRHIMASGALPPGFPAVEIEGEHCSGRRTRAQTRRCNGWPRAAPVAIRWRFRSISGARAANCPAPWPR